MGEDFFDGGEDFVALLLVGDTKIKKRHLQHRILAKFPRRFSAEHHNISAIAHFWVSDQLG